MSAPSPANFLDETGRGESLYERQDANPGTNGGKHGALAANQGFGPVVAAFDVDVRPHGRKESMGADLGEDDNGVDASERGEDGGALFLRHQRATRPFELADRTIAVQADNEEVAELLGALEIGDMAEVKQIKATVGDDDALAVLTRQSGPAGGLWQR